MLVKKKNVDMQEPSKVQTPDGEIEISVSPKLFTVEFNIRLTEGCSEQIKIRKKNSFKSYTSIVKRMRLCLNLPSQDIYSKMWFLIELAVLASGLWLIFNGDFLEGVALVIFSLLYFINLHLSPVKR